MGHTDLGVLFLPLDQSDLEVVPLGPVALELAVPPGHRLAGRRSVRCAQLAGEDWVTVPAHKPARRWVEQASEAAGFAARVNVEVDTIGQLTAFVSAGAGIALVPPSAVARDALSGMLGLVRVVAPVPHPEVCMAYRRQEPSPAVRAVSELLSEVVPGLHQLARSGAGGASP